MATDLISPRGYRVAVADGNVDKLLRAGYARPKPVPAKPEPEAAPKRRPGRPRKNPTDADTK
jgi:hypothetical protein